MVAQPGFCSQCGAPLRAGARFCASCGASVTAIPAAPPAAPAYQPPQQVVYQSAPPTGYPLQPAYVAQRAPARRRPRAGTVLLIAAGVLLLLLLLARFVALQVVGETTLATVTAVELVDSDEYAYQISYTFGGPGDTAVQGSTTLNDVLNVGTLPTVGDTVTVRYLPFLPAINEIVR